MGESVDITGLVISLVITLLILCLSGYFAYRYPLINGSKLGVGLSVAMAIVFLPFYWFAKLIVWVIQKEQKVKIMEGS